MSEKKHKKMKEVDRVVIRFAGGEDLNEVSRKVLSKIPRTGGLRSYVYAGYTFNYLLDKDLQPSRNQ